MPEIIFHPDWPAFDKTREELTPDYEGADPSYWDLPGALSDLATALDYQQALWVEPLHPEKINIDIWDVARIERYYIESHDQKVDPKIEPGSELRLYVVGELKDGRWFSIEAWNDYTGWGCQDNSDIRVGHNEQHVVTMGLTDSARKELGYV